MMVKMMCFIKNLASWFEAFASLSVDSWRFLCEILSRKFYEISSSNGGPIGDRVNTTQFPKSEPKHIALCCLNSCSMFSQNGLILHPKWRHSTHEVTMVLTFSASLLQEHTGRRWVEWCLLDCLRGTLTSARWSKSQGVDMPLNKVTRKKHIAFWRCIKHCSVITPGGWWLDLFESLDVYVGSAFEWSCGWSSHSVLRLECVTTQSYEHMAHPFPPELPAHLPHDKLTHYFPSAC